MIVILTGLVIDRDGRKGSAGAGKSTVAHRLVEQHDFRELSYAGPAKEFLRYVLDLSEEQLYGPSESRNAVDDRYPPTPYRSEPFSARYALTSLCTGWGRNLCRDDMWARHGMRTALRFERDFGFDVVFSDGRHRNELEVGRECGALLVRVVRPVERLFVYTDHRSECELNDLPDSYFDHVIVGEPANVADLQSKADAAVSHLRALTVTRRG